MPHSRGLLSIDRLFTTDEIGVHQNASLDRVIKAFLTIGEAVASRWIEMPRGVLLLQSVPGDPASGAIYLYDREGQIFYSVEFRRGRGDNLTVAEFEQLVAEYDLLSWTANAQVLDDLLSLAASPATAGMSKFATA